MGSIPRWQGLVEGRWSEEPSVPLVLEQGVLSARSLQEWWNPMMVKRVWVCQLEEEPQVLRQDSVSQGEKLGQNSKCSLYLMNQALQDPQNFSASKLLASDHSIDAIVARAHLNQKVSLHYCCGVPSGPYYTGIQTNWGPLPQSYRPAQHLELPLLM